MFYTDRPHHATAMQEIFKYLTVTLVVMVGLYLMLKGSIDIEQWLGDLADEVGVP